MKNKKVKGFTLVEVIVVTFVISLYCCYGDSFHFSHNFYTKCPRACLDGNCKLQNVLRCLWLTILQYNFSIQGALSEIKV